MITSYGFLVLFFGGLSAAFFYSAAWSFYIYQIVYFLHPTSRWWGSLIPDLSWSFISACSMLLLVVIQQRRAITDRLTLSQLPHIKWLFFLGAWMAVVSFYALNPNVHREFMFDYWKLIIIVILASQLINSGLKLDYALAAYLVGAAYIGWEAYSVGRTGAGRLEGIGMIDAPDANGTAAALAPALPIVVYLLWHGSVRMKVIAIVCGALIANAIVLINSRGSFLGVGTGLLYLFFIMTFARNRTRGQLAIVAVFVIAGAIATAVVTDDVFWERMSTLTAEDEGTSGSSRTRLWKSSIDVAQDYPFGTGVRGFQRLSRIYVDPEMFFQEKSNGKAVHSMWFQCLSEMGWLGPLLLIGLLNCCRRGSKAVKKVLKESGQIGAYYRCITLEAALLSSLVAGSFIDAFRAQILYWLVLFFIVQYSLYAKLEKKSGELLAEQQSRRAVSL